MKNTLDKVILNRDRVKSEMKTLHGSGKRNGEYTNTDLANLWNYENPESVSPFLNGTAIDKKLAQKFADKCNVRLEYLIGTDDWRTDDDMYESLDLSALKAYSATIEYLKTLEFRLNVCPYWYTNTDKYFNDLPFMKDYISSSIQTEEMVSEAEENERRLSNERIKSWQEKHHNDDDIVFPPRELYIELSKLPPTLVKPKIYLNSGLQSLYTNRFVVGGFSYFFSDRHIPIEMRYKISYKDLYIGTCDISKISSFLQAINNSTSTLIKSLLNFQCLLSEDHINSLEYENLINGQNTENY